MKEFKELLEKYGVTMKQISDTYGIPYETLKSWKSDSVIKGRSCPPYILSMLDRLLEIDSRPAPSSGSDFRPVTFDMGDDFTMTVAESDDSYDLWINCSGYGVADLMFGVPKDAGLKTAIDTGMYHFGGYREQYEEDHMA